ncbi:MAG: hypothetical protein L6Q98_17665 [Anaerolineae bacterium]|nr:hypothetical protein [Anaerolineae bacterium]NUQ05965.1 hypothetical protein [Anaerolineae bacterium]
MATRLSLQPPEGAGALDALLGTEEGKARDAEQGNEHNFGQDSEEFHS